MTNNEKIFILNEFKNSQLRLLGKKVIPPKIKYFEKEQWSYILTFDNANGLFDRLENVTNEIKKLEKEIRLEKIKLIKNDKSI